MTNSISQSTITFLFGVVISFCLLSCATVGLKPSAVTTKPGELYTPPKEALVIFNDVIPSYGYTYPENGLYCEWTDEKKSGLASLRFQWKAGKGSWCGGGIGLVAPIDLIPHRQTGKFVFWIKGRKGLENVRKVGFQDSDGYYSMRPLSLYCREITRDWQQIIIPLAHFSDDALRWDAAIGQEIPGTINWSSIAQVKFDFGEGTGEENTIYVDEIMILP